MNSVNKIQEIECIEEKIKEILIETILENNNIECEGAWYAKPITSEEFDSLSMVNFMVAIEEEFKIYIDEESMEKIDFMGSYQNMIDGIVKVVNMKVVSKV